jgi:hypothetical protein
MRLVTVTTYHWIFCKFVASYNWPPDKYPKHRDEGRLLTVMVYG